MAGHEAETTADEGLQEEEKDGSTLVASMLEIGEIVNRIGVYSENESITRMLDSQRKTIEIPLPDGTKLVAFVSFPLNKDSLINPSIGIALKGPSPAHYRKPEVTRKSVSLLGDAEKDYENPSLRITVNKFFYPEAKNFQTPEIKNNWEIKSGEISYRNKDGEDSCEVEAPKDRLGLNVLIFAEDFVSSGLALLIDYENQTKTIKPPPKVLEISA